MRQLLLLPLAMFLLGCAPDPVKMQSFKVLDQNNFEMCFSQEVEEGLYALIIKTKAGQEIKRAGQLSPAGATCFTQTKMQHGPSAYSSAQTRFYADSLTTENIASVTWSISRRYYEAPLASGTFEMP